MKPGYWLVITTVLIAGGMPAQAAELDRKAYEASVKPLFDANCMSCHGKDKQKAGLDLRELDPDMVKGPDVELWNELLEQIIVGDMPPKKEPRPDAKLLQASIQWINKEMERSRQAKRSTAGRVVMRRMGKRAYQFALQDLLGLSLELTGDLPPEAISDDGFDNNGQQIGMTGLHFENYLAIARYALDHSLVAGPRPEHVQVHIDYRNANKDPKSPPSFAAVGFHSTNKPEGLRLQADMRKAKGNQEGRFGGHGGFRMLDKSGRKGSWSVGTGMSSVVPTADGLVMAPTSAIGPGKNSVNLGITFHKIPKFTAQDMLRVKVVAYRQAHPQDPSEHARPGRLIIHAGGYHRSGIGARIMDVDVTAGPDKPQVFHLSIPFEQSDIPLGNFYTSEAIPFVFNINNNRPKIQTKQETKVIDGKKRKVRTTIPDKVPYPKIVIQSVEIECGYQDSWPSPAYNRIMAPAQGAKDRNAAQNIIAAFARRAFGHQATSSQMQSFLKVYDASQATGDAFIDSIKLSLTAVLCAPNFLYLVEPNQPAAKDEPRTVTAHELARRLSMFLWNSIPDDELSACAEDGSLLKEAVLRAQYERLLAHPRGRRGLRDFAFQWLELKQLANVNINSKLFNDRSEGNILDDMREETLRTYEHLVLEGYGIKDVIAGDFSFINQRLAGIYGINQVFGQDFRLVKRKPNSQRRGLLGHASILTRTADGTHTNPILRGAWMLRVILNDPPPPPPPVVPTLEEKLGNQIKKLSIRAQLKKHRDDPACFSCHAAIDPWGFPFEQFDAIGRKRGAGKGKGKAPDTEAKFSDGTSLAGMSAMLDYLQGPKYQKLVTAYVRKLTVYALGRGLEFIDDEDMEALSQHVAKASPSLKEIHWAIINHKLFRTK